MNQTSVAIDMPNMPTKAARLPRSMPVATAKRLAGPGVAAMTIMTLKKAQNLVGSTGSCTGSGLDRAKKKGGREVSPHTRPTVPIATL